MNLLQQLRRDSFCNCIIAANLHTSYNRESSTLSKELRERLKYHYQCRDNKGEETVNRRLIRYKVLVLSTFPTLGRVTSFRVKFLPHKKTTSYSFQPDKLKHVK